MEQGGPPSQRSFVEMGVSSFIAEFGVEITKAVVDQSWERVFRGLTQEPLTAATSRGKIEELFRNLWDLRDRDDAQLSDDLFVAFFHSFADDNPKYTDALGGMYLAPGEMLFEQTLNDLSLDASLTGETSMDPHALARLLKAYASVTFVSWSFGIAEDIDKYEAQVGLISFLSHGPQV